jgi:transposase
MTTDCNEARQERPRRRRYDEAFKRALVEQTLAPGVSVARIAREHGINANQLFTWRRQFARTERETPVPARQVQASASLVPVTVVADETAADGVAAPVTGDGQIEIRVAGATLRIRGAVDAATLQMVLASLRR